MRHKTSSILRTTAVLALCAGLASPAWAQVTIDSETTTQIRTSTAGTGGTASDVTINDAVAVTNTGVGPAVVLDSDNALIQGGDITIEDIDGATGVELQGGADRSYSQTGTISIVEDYTATNTDDDPFADGPAAIGTGRTGILISGASPFQGNIELASGSSVLVEGNDSFGINLSNTPMMVNGLTGNLNTEGVIGVTGQNSTGVFVGSDVTGDLNQLGSITARGEGARAYVVEGDIQGGFTNADALNATGYRFGTRPPFGGESSTAGREDLGAEDLVQAGSALSINGNVTGGVFLDRLIEEALDADGAPLLNDEGEQLFTLVSTSAVTQLGGAPAVLIDGNGTPIAIGRIAEITDPADEDYDADLQYAFVNEGTVTASGLYDDVDATAFYAADVTLEDGINNQGTMSAQSFRGAIASADAIGSGIAKVIVLGDAAIADKINNSGIILASASEAIDQVYADANNVIAPRDIQAVGIDIEAGATAGSLTNTGSISAILIGREGQAVAIRDTSGTLLSVDNQGLISATGTNSDPSEESAVNFDLVAIDVSTLTQGFTLTQSQTEGTEATPIIRGDILLGSGDDMIMASAGEITGDIDFGGGNDSLSLSGASTFIGEIRNTDALALSVIEGSTLALNSATPINVSSATFDATSVFSPVIDGSTGGASTLVSDGDITFESGATISPTLNNIVGTNTLEYSLVSAGNLSIGDLVGLSSGDTPFLYNTSLGFAADDPNTLVVTLDLRDPNLSVANGGLGLDSVQSAAFGTGAAPGPVLQALTNNAGLGNAFSNITTSDGFYSAYNQVLPEFAAAAKQFVLANVDGAVGAVGSHLDTARRSPDKTGGAWIQEFAYFADRDKAGLSEQYRGEGFGFTGGLDTAFGPFHAVGVNFGFSSSEVEDVVGVDEPLDVLTYQAGLYAGLQKGAFNFDVYGGMGISEFDQNRRVRINDFFGTATGAWTGTHYNAAVRAGYDIPLSDKFWMRPTVSLDYLNLNETGYTETGTQGVRLRVDGRYSETAALTAMLNVGAVFEGKRTWIRPSIRAGYRNEFLSDPTITPFRFQGLQGANGALFDSELAELRSLAFPEEGIILGFSVAAGSAYSSIGFDFDSDIRDGFIRHTGRVVIRLLF